jgi:hypothetical protein
MDDEWMDIFSMALFVLALECMIAKISKRMFRFLMTRTMRLWWRYATP